MKCIQLKLLILWLLGLPNYLQSITIYDRIDVLEGLHIDKKNPQQMKQTGFSYNDADDVIHIIEPPQHFQEMKRRHRQQHEALSNVLGARLKNPVLQVTAPTIVKELAKVEKPEMHERLQRHNRRRPTIAAVNLKAGPHDLLTQETQQHAENYHPKFPVEILASMRQTERQQTLQQKPQHPYARQRVKMQKTHTVIMERGYEQTRYKHGQENRAAGGFKANNKNSKVKRLRRSVAVTSSDIDHAQHVAYLNIEQGSKLLVRLDALLKHATSFLPDDNETATHNNVLDELRKRFQQEFEPKQLIGEIEPTTTSISVRPERELYQILESSLNATDSIMQELIQKHSGTPQPSSKCIIGETFNIDDSRLQQLQTKIDCMRQQLTAVRESAASTTSTTSTTLAPVKPILSSTLTRGNTRFGQRTRSKVATTNTTTTITTTFPSIKNVARTKNQRETAINASVGLDAFPVRRQRFLSQRAKSTTKQLNAGNVTAAAAILLYDDVMSNIRNMLEAKNLKLSDVLQESRTADGGHHAGEEAAIAIDFIEASASASASATESPSTLSEEDTSNFRDLNRYLSDLQQIVMRLPQTKTEFNSNSNSRSGTHTDWYLINEEGKISETPFDVPLQPTAVIFHRFPDIPNAAVYVRNRTILPAKTATTTQSENIYEMF